jgi:hypothetical protein
MGQIPLVKAASPETNRAAVACDVGLWLLVMLPVVALGLWLGYQSLQPADCEKASGLAAVAHWFDPLFFQYNLVLSSTAILLVPAVPFFYVYSMAWRKRARLQRDLSEADFRRIDGRLERRSRFQFYFGSVVLTMIFVTLGVSILLFFKPVRTPGECGVDFSRGGNMLILGPFVEMYGNAAKDGFESFYQHLVYGLVGFQFGFLGAYVYFLNGMARAYFALDLTPETMIDGSIRIGIASVLSLVLSFGVGTFGADSALPLLPIISFFFGFFPRRALAFLEQIVLKAINLSVLPYQVTPLSALFGMSYGSELRLEREGFDSAETLSHADPVDLAVRTGFDYRQLRQWVSEAWLVRHLRDDYADFVRRTGVTSRTELEDYFQAVPGDDRIEFLLAGEASDTRLTALRSKLAVIHALLTTDGSAPGPAADSKYRYVE